MNYGYKPTTEGRELLAALIDVGGDLEITEVAVGSGKVAEDVNLADMNDLIRPVSSAGAIAQRRHIGNVLHLTVQYASNSTPGLGAFYLAEFIVKAKHPISGKNVTLLYATLGDYIQPVKAYSETEPPDIRNYPINLVLSDEIDAKFTVAAGLVTYDDLNEVVQEVGSCIIRDITIPAAGWVAHGITEDPEYAKYPYMADVAVDGCTEQHFPTTSISRVSEDAAAGAGMSANADTFDGYARFFAKRVPEADLTATIQLRSENLMTPGGGSSISTDDIATDEEANQTINNAFG